MLYQEKVRHGKFEVSKTHFQRTLAKGALVGPHVFKMIKYVEKLDILDFLLRKELMTNLIIQSLSESFN